MSPQDHTGFLLNVGRLDLFQTVVSEVGMRVHVVPPCTSRSKAAQVHEHSTLDQDKLCC